MTGDTLMALLLMADSSKFWHAATGNAIAVILPLLTRLASERLQIHAAYHNKHCWRAFRG